MATQKFASLPIAYGTATTATASDTIATGLKKVTAVIVSAASGDETNKFFFGSIGDQAGTPAAGSFLLVSKKDTDADAALVDATTFGIVVNWIALGN